MRASALLAGVALSLCAACVDPKGEFNQFVNRVGHGSATDASLADAGSCTVLPNSVSGNYLFALSVSLASTKPIVLLTGVTTPAFNGGTGLAFSAQPLSAADRKTPVGDPLVLGPFAVDASGHFTAPLPGLHITGAANSITPGADITADVTLVGNLCGDGSFFCGTADGKVTQPIPLDLTGSTFTLTKLDPANDTPAQPKINCAGALSDPVGM